MALAARLLHETGPGIARVQQTHHYPPEGVFLASQRRARAPEQGNPARTTNFALVVRHLCAPSMERSRPATSC